VPISSDPTGAIVQEAKRFFFEKKNQKTFALGCVAPSLRRAIKGEKSLFASFSPEKEGLPWLRQAHRSAA